MCFTVAGGLVKSFTKYDRARSMSSVNERPVLLAGVVALVLLPGAWLAVRLGTDLEGIERLCRAATWYAASRCDSGRILARGVTALLVPVLGIASAGIWLIAAPTARAIRWRDALAAQEGELVARLREACRSVPRSHWAALAAITVIAVLVRLPLLGEPMRSDENQTLLLYSGRSFEAALWQFDTTNNHILFSVLSRAPIALFGASPWSARMVEVICGILLVPATALALRGVRTPPAALVGAALVAGLPYLAAFSANARGYSLIALLFVLAVPLACRLAGTVDCVAWMLFVLLTALALLTNPVAVYPMGALGIWIASGRLLHQERRWRAAGDVVVAGVVIGMVSWALYAPALTAMGTEALFANPWMRPPTWSEFTGTLGIILDGTARELWWQWGWGLPRWAIGASVAAMVIGLATDLRREWPARGLIVVLVGWTAVMAVLSHRVPYTRVLLPYLPVLLVAAAGSIITIFSRAGLPTRDESRAWAVAAVVLATILCTARASARTVEMTLAPHGAAVWSPLLSSLDARSCVIGDWPTAHGARAHARARIAGGHAEHA